MQPDQIPQADLLDILFEGRNKDYGAYDLRKNYNRRLRKAILFTLSLCLLLIFGYVLAGRPAAVNHGVPAITVDILTEITPPDKRLITPPPARRTVSQQVATITDLRPLIVPDDQVRPEDRPHTVDEMNDAKLGTVNKPGNPDDNTGPVGPPNDGGKDLFTAPTQNSDDSNSIILIVEVESKYKGGPAAWQRFLQKNFHPSEAAIANGIQGTVTVQFIVDRAGNVSDVQAISGPEEYKEEAIRVIKKSGHWYPAIQNGRHVSSYKKQPFVVLLGNND